MPLTNAQYDQIMRGYQQRQLQRQHLITQRKKEVYDSAPQLARLDGEIASLSVQKAHNLLNGDEHALDDLKEQIASRTREKEHILQNMGYDRDYFSPPYTCPDCQDTGYIGNRRCHCLKQAAIDLVYTQSNLRGALVQENFSCFSLAYYADDIFDPHTNLSSREAARTALAKCREFVQTFDNSFENLLLFGDTGMGKTFLSHCIAKELLDTGHSVIYFSAHQLFDILTQNALGKGDTREFDYRNIFDCDLLIIDDLGTELTNTLTTSQCFVCINERIMNRKSTLISSNLDVFELMTIYSERIFSRISNNFTMLHLFGKDIRLQKKLTGK